MVEAGLEYTLEAEAEREKTREEQEAEDRQEALSSRFAAPLRLVLLSSGNWAIFRRATGGEPALRAELDENELKLWAEEDLQDYDREADRARADRAGAGEVAKSEMNLEDMGL